MIRRITDFLPKPEHDFIYDVLARMPPTRLCVDVGAAAGQATRRIRKAGGPDTAVVAFEPFPGNEQFFAKETRDLTNVSLVWKAIGDQVGSAEFLVPQVVTGTEKSWEGYAGYSSTGFLTDWPSAKDWRSDFRRSLRDVAKIALSRVSKKGRRLTVDTTTLDKEFKGRKIDFLKIDVQGGEERVLLGAAGLLADGSIPLIYLEWNGSHAVVDLLHRFGYQVFDSVYVVFPRGAPRSKFEDLGLQFVGDVALSSGQPAYEMILNGGSMSPADVVNRARAIGMAGIQTDLIAVHPSQLQAFMEALKGTLATAVSDDGHEVAVTAQKLSSCPAIVS